MNNKIRNVDDIKNGYLIETRNGTLYMCMCYKQDEFKKIFVQECRSGWLEGWLFNGLKHIRYKCFDIVKVYGLSEKAIESLNFNTEDRSLLYIEPKKMTIKEIEKELGYKIEIMEENN